MKYQIDQSGKIEQMSKDTVLCLSNDKWESVMIKAKVKRQVQEIFRRNGQARNFIIFAFCAGLAILLKRRYNHIYDVVIDREYLGKESIIKNILLEMLKRGQNLPTIYFGSIGKKALAHHRAYAVAIGKLQASYVISLSEILDKIKMTEVGKRLKNA